MRNIIRFIVNGTGMESAEPIVVSIGPIKQNIIREKVIDLAAVAVPITSFSDGGCQSTRMGYRCYFLDDKCANPSIPRCILYSVARRP